MPEKPEPDPWVETPEERAKWEAWGRRGRLILAKYLFRDFHYVPPEAPE